jgi:hypothetical protein
MILPPDDPIQVWINRAHKLALTLMDEQVTIMSGMNTPNQIVTTGMDFESLDSEPDPNKLRGVARQLNRLRERTQQQFLAAIVFEQLRLPRQTH